MAVRPHVSGTSLSEFDYDEGRTFVWRGRENTRHCDELCLSHPGEPIHVRGRRGSSMGGALVISLALCAMGWGALKTEAAWWPWVSDQISAAVAVLERASHDDHQYGKRQGQAVADMSAGQPTEPMMTRDLADAPQVAAGIATGGSNDGPVKSAAATGEGGEAVGADASADTQVAAANGTQDAGGGDGASEPGTEVTPLPAPIVDPSNPYQKRALSVGLHPELSRVLLSRLSDADYRNAGIAIQKAVAEVGDSDKLIWPQQRQSKLALFNVHFVAGAAPDCRRYVVVVTKDGWSTTAQPMERCGVKRLRRSAS